MHSSKNLQVSMQTGKMIFEEDGKEVCYHVHLLFGNVILILETLSVKNARKYLRCHMRKKLKWKKWSDVDNADISKHFQMIFEILYRIFCNLDRCQVLKVGRGDVVKREGLGLVGWPISTAGKRKQTQVISKNLF